MNVNKVFLAGNLTRDPQLKYLPNNTPLCEFGIANNRRWKSSSGEDKEAVVFLDCVAFGKVGETINQHFTKGKAIFLEGRIGQDEWTDKQTGKSRRATRIIVGNFQFVGSRQDQDGERSNQPTEGQPVPPRNAPPREPRSPQTPANEPLPPAGRHFTEDDIPFDNGR